MQLALGLGVVLLLASGLAAYDAVVRLRAAQSWVSHTRDVQTALSDLNNVGTRAGRARTRYIDSGDEAFYQDYQAAASDIPEKLKQLQHFTADNPEQQDNWTHLQEITNRRLKLLNDSVQLRRSGSSDLAEQADLRQQIIVVSAEADALLQRMQDAEQQLLDMRRDHSERLFRTTGFILATAFLLALILFFLHYLLLKAELSAREQAEESLRGLSVRLLELQDQERRKFSRELHDSLGQYLVGVKMNLTMLSNSISANPLVTESLDLLDQAITETRTISHLLHPPLLDETGFESAARWYVEGFAKRSGIPTSLDIPDNLGRLAESVELALFRVLQEESDQCSSPFEEPESRCFAAIVQGRSCAADQGLRKGYSNRCDGPLSPQSSPRRSWVGRNAGAYPRTWRTIGNGFGWRRHPDFGQDAAIGAQERPRRFRRLID